MRHKYFTKNFFIKQALSYIESGQDILETDGGQLILSFQHSENKISDPPLLSPRETKSWRKSKPRKRIYDAISRGYLDVNEGKPLEELAKQYRCYTCPLAEDDGCKYAWDAYNIGSDWCLAEK